MSFFSIVGILSLTHVMVQLRLCADISGQWMIQRLRFVVRESLLCRALPTLATIATLEAVFPRKAYYTRYEVMTSSK